MSFQELRNYERELHQFHLRLAVAGVAVLIAFTLLVGRFVFLQVVQRSPGYEGHGEPDSPVRMTAHRRRRLGRSPTLTAG